MGTSIIAAGKEFDIKCKVVLWNETDGLDLYQYKNYSARKINHDELKNKIKNFTCHHSVTYRARHTYNGLNSRKLSVNFIIDDDNVGGYATIYQCLDIKDCGWSQGICNATGAGVEISFMPQAWENPNLYSEANKQKHSVPEHLIDYDTVHGRKLKIFKPTQAQVNSLIQLIWGYCELFPNINIKFPRDNNGNLIKTSINKPEQYNGILNHYNITNKKIDTLGLSLEYIETEVGNRKLVGY